MNLFEGKEIDDIDVHDILLRMTLSSSSAYSETGWITLKSIMVYLLTVSHPMIFKGDIVRVANLMDDHRDNRYGEVADMKSILHSI